MKTPCSFVCLTFALLLAAASAHAQSALNRSVRTAESLEPAIPHSEQDKGVAAKLAALEKKTGKKPNVVWLLVDDMGFGDPGCYGGGKAIGADTPHMDRLAVQDTATAPWLFNPYIDPKEELPVGHRMNAWLAAEMGSHAATFKKYPPKKIGL